MKKVPSYWWDFEEDVVIVQSDLPGGEKIASFSGDQKGIDEAEKLISDFEAGRKTPDWKR